MSDTLRAEIAAIRRSLDNIEAGQRLLLRVAKAKPPAIRHSWTPFRERLAAANRRPLPENREEPSR